VPKNSEGSKLKEIIKLGLELALTLPGEKEQVQFYLTYLNNGGILTQVPSRFIDIALGSILLYSKQYKSLQ
jgi:hypothetical protein